jgi:hypothetical protein
MEGKKAEAAEPGMKAAVTNKAVCPEDGRLLRKKVTVSGDGKM